MPVILEVMLQYELILSTFHFEESTDINIF